MAVVILETLVPAKAPLTTPIDIVESKWRANENVPWAKYFSLLDADIKALINGNSVFVSGTLSPDERPAGLGPSDTNQVLFYSTDKDHLLRWTGTAWQCIDYSAGTIAFKIVAPTSNGWVLCNGVGTASMMLPDGSLSVVTVPDMVGSYPKGGTSYSGATPTAANAPGLTGTPGGTVTPFTPAGTVSSVTISGTISGTPSTSANDTGHVHDEGSLTGAAVYSTVAVMADEAGTIVVQDPITVNVTGNTGDESNTHSHTVNGSGFTFTGNNVTPTFTGALASPGFTGSIGTLAVDATAQPKHTTLLPYLRL